MNDTEQRAYPVILSAVLNVSFRVPLMCFIKHTRLLQCCVTLTWSVLELQARGTRRGLRTGVHSYHFWPDIGNW